MPGPSAHAGIRPPIPATDASTSPARNVRHTDRNARVRRVIWVWQVRSWFHFHAKARTAQREFFAQDRRRACLHLKQDKDRLEACPISTQLAFTAATSAVSEALASPKSIRVLSL